MSGEEPDRKGKGRRRQQQTPRIQPDQEAVEAAAEEAAAAAEAAAWRERRRRASRPASAGPSTSTAAPRRTPSPQHPSTSSAPSPSFRHLMDESAEDIFRRVARRRELGRMFGTPPKAPKGPMARGDGGPGFRRATSEPPGKCAWLADPRLQRSPLRLQSSLDRPRNRSHRRNQRDDIETRHSRANTPPDKGEDVDSDTPSGDDPFGLRCRRPPSPP